MFVINAKRRKNKIQIVLTSYLETKVTEYHQTCLKMRPKDKQTATENDRY